ncbi:carbon-nitrogen hydrolase family protein [Thalassotalea sediminis]|uniref:carbon-nitrogen hydrolase family protein n=1 Tax=Thalassotalea sediminis TaxID=1759089 RepID=UPI002574050D|nr:carbon-nitrogen hydrolase family protein [Thalassotalea sediminis]
MVKLSAIQLTSTPNVDENLAVIEQQLKEITAINESCEHIIVLPECCLFFGGKDAEQLALAKETCQSDRLSKALSRLAKNYAVSLVAGSIPIYRQQTDKFTNTCCVFDKTGLKVAEYDKLHLFDVEVEDNEKQYLESRYTQPGNKVVTVSLADVTVGLAICYDLRFPELFRELCKQGAQVITLPSAFTRVTGKAHWLALLKARAIENQVYIVAAGQVGTHSNGRETYGHSLIVDPWGEVVTQLPDGLGYVSAQFEPSRVTQVRTAIPVATHNKFTTKLINNE